ncbi:FG-GAP repeat protein [Pseudoalteromonas sp. XMcav1-K]|uniref:FG-GAP repeat protein n=1 Tax=Pseudoalteromonas sp. XMcav1-K TaxID=3374372 RepID=UPI003757CDFF
MRVSHKVKFGLSFLVTVMINQVHANQQQLLAYDGKHGDNFAYGVAIDGNTILVGAHKADSKNAQDSGAGYIYSLGSNGWQFQQKLIASPAFSNDTMGGKVALKGNMALLGAIGRSDKGENAGAVISFERVYNNWQQTQVLGAFDAKPGDSFGQSIAITEKILVIGAPKSDAIAKDAGAVYVYQRVNNAWQFQVKLTASDGAAGDLFGISLAIDGNTVLVGADLNDQQNNNAGAVYVFEFNGVSWQQQAKLVASDGGDTDIFGVRVAIFGDTALISARRDDIEGVGKDAGSAYIFVRKNGKWRQHQKLRSPDLKADDRFGRGVAIQGNTALVSAMHHDASGENAGAVYVFNKAGDTWQYSSKIVAENAAPHDKFGWNVAMSDQHAVIATPNRDDNGEQSGAAYVNTLQTTKP